MSPHLVETSCQPRGKKGKAGQRAIRTIQLELDFSAEECWKPCNLSKCLDNSVQAFGQDESSNRKRIYFFVLATFNEKRLSHKLSCRSVTVQVFFTAQNGDSEQFREIEKTKLPSCIRRGVWFLQITAGGKTPPSAARLLRFTSSTGSPSSE